MQGQDYTEKLKWSEELANKVIKEYKPYAVIVGLTTGFDSIVALELANRFFDLDAVFTCNTTISAPETLQQCEDVAKSVYKLKHICRCPPYAGKSEHSDVYFELVKRHGFPGKTTTAHSWMYRYLKDHTVSRILSSIRQGKRNRPIVVISGARKGESVRRFGTSKNISVNGNNIWVNICNEWSDAEVGAFAEDNRLKRLRSPISKTIGISGECFCGCFSEPGELNELKIASPTTYEKITGIHKWLKENTDKDWGWERGPSMQYVMEKYGQIPLFTETGMAMCSTCLNNSNQNTDQ